MAYLGNVGGVDVYSDAQGCFYYDDVLGQVPIACPQRLPALPTVQPNQGSIVYPKTTGTTTLDKILATSLSTIALLTRQNQVPTTQSPYGSYPYGAVNPYGVNPYSGVPLNSISGSGNTLGNLENWVKTHTFETAILIGAVLFYLLPSPVRRKNGLTISRNPKRRRKSSRRARRR